MNYYEATVRYTATERQLRRLVEAEPAAQHPDQRLDVIHKPDVDLLWGGKA